MNYCFVVLPLVERLESGFLLSDAPGISLDELPEAPVEVPLAPLDTLDPSEFVFLLDTLGLGF